MVPQRGLECFWRFSDGSWLPPPSRSVPHRKPVIPSQLLATFISNQCSDLSNTSAIISRETTRYSVRNWPYLAEAHTIYVFCLCSHPCNGKNLPVFCYALLEFAKEYAKSCNC